VTKVIEAAALAPETGDDFGAALSNLAVLAGVDPGGAVERHLRTVTSFLPLVICSMDATGTIRSCFGGGLAALGVEDGELVGEPIESFGQEGRALFDAVMAGGATRTVAIEGVTDEEPWHFFVVGAPYPDGSGMAVVGVDTTAQALAELAHLRSEGLLAAAIEAIDEGVLVQDLTGRVVRANSSAIAMFGLLGGDIDVGLGRQGGWQSIHPDGSPFLPEQRPGRRSLVTGKPERDVLMGLTKEGAPSRWLSVNSFPVQLHADQFVVSTITDVTDQREMTAALSESELRFRMLAESAPIGIFITDEEGSITYVNPEVERQTGYAFEAFDVLTWERLVHPDDRETVAAARRGFRDGAASYLVEHRLVVPDGPTRWVRVRMARMTGAAGEIIGVVGTSADITDFVIADEKLREREERTAAILETAADGIITADESRTIIEFNAAAERMLGYDSDEVVGRLRFDDMLAPEVRDTLVYLFEDYLAGGDAQFVGMPATEVEYVRKDGGRLPVELAVTEVVTSEGRLFTGVIHDISERKAFERQLEHQSTHDSLTGLPNRALLVAELEAGLNRAARHQAGVGVLFVELGRINLVTDSLGHRAGDQLILAAAGRLLHAVSGVGGTVTRFGGDHFVVFIEDLDDVGDAVEIATAIIEELDRPYTVASEEAFIKAYVGIAFAPAGAGTAESLISNADVAMNRARDAANVGFEVFDTEMRAWVDSRRKLEIAMRHGIERGEFELFYQPVVEIKTQSIHGFEALVRWHHPELGLLPPSEFIPLAEDSGLIVSLGERILCDACEQLARWQRAYPERGLTVSVNLSGRQLALNDLPATVAAALLGAGADPKGLDLEITETVLLDDVEAATRTLNGLKKIGVNLSMDDFGTGYSSLTYLCQFPIDVVKVDRSFVSMMGANTRDASIVSIVVGLAQTLQLVVVAEGVETKEQLDTLDALDCQYAQGYYFAKALPAADAEKLLIDGFDLPGSMIGAASVAESEAQEVGA
jgi:diguanylate cyclase (GGDEF)-like protein/PAS domain S-box-containing protein